MNPKLSLRSWTLTFVIVGIVAYALLVFAAVVSPRNVLFCTDDNIGGAVAAKCYLPQAFAAQWSSGPLVGSGGSVTPTWTAILLWLLPLNAFVSWVHACHLGVASLFLMLFLRDRGARLTACVLGGLAVLWVGTNFTLVYAGHDAKFGVLAFAAIALWSGACATCSDRWGWVLLSGGAFGMMLLEQQDVAVFFGMFLVPYLVFTDMRVSGRHIKQQFLRLATMGGMVLLIAGSGSLRVYAANVKEIDTQSQEESPQAKWEFVTQWSVPPDETIDLVAPNYFGIRSGEAAGPYWGRTGRSAGWEKTRQGFMNFRLESIYIGAIPVAFALFAVTAALFGGGVGGRGARGGQPSEISGQKSEVTQEASLSIPAPRPSSAAPRPPPLDPLSADRRAEILFWGAVAVITLLLAYGKYFPLYALFYKLPVVNNIRNPNKFLQVFQLALGILAAYGLDTAMKWRRDSGR